MIRVTDAREHNLRHVSVAAPRDSFVVFTGVSGSGKSSLAFGTVYAEAQRRYLESVAPYARRLIDQVGAPKVGDITGLPTAIALQQRRGTPSSRSTVGTITMLSNSLRMLFSRAGTYPAGTTERLDSDAFSPNTPVGACLECHGLGQVHDVTEASMVPDPSLSIREKAVAAWPGAWQGKNYLDILVELGHDVDRPWRELPQAERDWILFTDEQPVVTVHPVRRADQIQREYQGTYMSARRYVMHTFATTGSATMRKRVSRFMVSRPCPTCHGARLAPAALAVTFAGRTVTELAALPLRDLAEVLRPTAELDHPAAAWASPDSGETTEAAVALARDLRSRIETLTELGLGYLAIGRSTPTLSAGELQRLRLATQLRSGLFGVLYVLDEPSAGLHPADTEALLAALERLRAAGNSLFVVEHDLDVVRRADWIVDVGPGAGERGGEVLYSGPVAGLEEVPASITRRYLYPDAGERLVRRVPRTPASWLELSGITRHNLRDVSAAIPLGAFTVVTGVSGSGKSTLVSQVLTEVVAEQLAERARLRPGRGGSGRDYGHRGGGAAPEADGEGDDTESRVEVESLVRQAGAVRVRGLDGVDRLVRVDQKPIGRTPRSNLATYTGLFDAVRKVFAATEGAKKRGWGVGRFSFNVPEGRCETCQGEGMVSVELLFLPGTYAPCPACHGARYNPETLEVAWRGRTIADVLHMTVEEAAGFFAEVPAAKRSLRTLVDVGLGYLRLGQPATELSGGEAQRIKLASELQRTRRGHTLYVLDEPTTGLHPADIDQLVAELQGLVDGGNTVVVVEHDMRVAAGADWVIDMGPGGGDAGGAVVAAGTPETVAACAESRTAPYLAATLELRA
jgi:excinuclease ABC subunit A